VSRRFTGGCLCGALRYEAEGEPRYAGLCFCGDCQKATGSAYAPFLGFAARDVRITGPSTSFACKAVNGGDATRNSCPACHSLVFGGDRDGGEDFNIYAGTLDDLSLFEPRIVIFNRNRPAWAPLSEGLRVFDAMPG
jgi:hypothetical protein